MQGKNVVKITFVGDLMCDARQLEALGRTHQTFDDVFKHIRGLFRDSDYVIGNLETPLAGAAVGYTKLPAYFNTPDEFAIALKKIGVDFVTTANNHCMDRNIFGLNRTLETLDRVGIGHTGTYAKKEDAEQIAVVSVGGIKFAFVAATYGFNSEDSRRGVSREHLSEEDEWRIDLLKRPARPVCRNVTGQCAPRSFSRRVKDLVRKILPSRIDECYLVLRHGLNKLAVARNDVQTYIADCVAQNEKDEEANAKRLKRYLAKLEKARKLADVVVALPHVGGQYNPAPGGYHKYIVQQILDTGVDLVVANHSHNPLPIYFDQGGALVAHSLGNFCYTPYVEWFVHHSLAEYGVVLNVNFDMKSKKIESADTLLVKNVVDANGIAYPILVDQLRREIGDAYQLDRLNCEVDAVNNKFRIGGN